VLCAALHGDADADEVLVLLQERDWYAHANRHIYLAIKACRDANQPVDVVTIAGRLRDSGQLAAIGGTPYLAQLSDATPAIANLGQHCRLVADKARQRRALDLFRRLALEAQGGIDDVGAWLQRAEAAVYDAAHDSASLARGITYRELMIRTMARIREAAEGKVEMGLPTGMGKLDRHVGGWRPKELWYIAGRPGSGKTSGVLQWGEHAVSYVNEPSVCGLFYSLEMAEEELGPRSLSRAAELPGRQVRTGRLQTREQWSALVARSKDLGRLPIIVDDAPDLTPLRLRSRVRHDHARLQREFGKKLRLGFVAVDYVQLMGVDRDRGENRVGELEEISRKLKLLAKEFDTCVVALSQLRRLEKTKGKAARPTLEDLRGSGALEQDADVVLAIHREDLYRPPGEKWDHIAELIVMKARNAGQGQHRVMFDGRFTGFYDTIESEGGEHEYD